MSTPTTVASFLFQQLASARVQVRRLPEQLLRVASNFNDGIDAADAVN